MAEQVAEPQGEEFVEDVVSEEEDFEGFEDEDHRPLAEPHRMPRVENPVEFSQFLVNPKVDKMYEDFVTKDLAISYFPNPKTVFFIEKYLSLINDFLFIGVPSMSKVYDAELKTIVTAMRSVKGFERTSLTTITQALKKIQETYSKDESEGGRKLFGRG